MNRKIRCHEILRILEKAVKNYVFDTVNTKCLHVLLFLTPKKFYEFFEDFEGFATAKNFVFCMLKEIFDFLNSKNVVFACRKS
ncbi:MAG: hypothetical protein ABFC34_04220 [Methanobacterium sp.]